MGVRTGRSSWPPLADVDWYNQRRLHRQIGNLPPAELEATYYRQLGQAAVA